jgi:hypothetical protein
MDTLEKFSRCRFFDGGAQCSYLSAFEQRLWEYERLWVETPDDDFADEIKSYRRFGLEDFSSSDGVPETLKALLWSRFIHWGGVGVEQSPSPEAFKHWYRERYLSRPIL